MCSAEDPNASAEEKKVASELVSQLRPRGATWSEMVAAVPAEAVPVLAVSYSGGGVRAMLYGLGCTDAMSRINLYGTAQLRGRGRAYPRACR
jgi:hypothetical protein